MQIYTLYRKGFSYVVWCPARFKHVDFGCVRLDSHSNHIFSRISGLTPYCYICMRLTKRQETEYTQRGMPILKHFGFSERLFAVELCEVRYFFCNFATLK